MAAPIDSDFNFFFITILHKTYEFRLFLSDNTVLYGKLSFTLSDINLLRLKMCEKNVQMKIGMGLFHVYVQLKITNVSGTKYKCPCTIRHKQQ